MIERSEQQRKSERKNERANFQKKERVKAKERKKERKCLMVSSSLLRAPGEKSVYETDYISE